MLEGLGSAFGRGCLRHPATSASFGILGNFWAIFNRGSGIFRIPSGVGFFRFFFEKSITGLKSLGFRARPLFWGTIFPHFLRMVWGFWSFLRFNCFFGPSGRGCSFWRFFGQKSGLAPLAKIQGAPDPRASMASGALRAPEHVVGKFWEMIGCRSKYQN